MDLLQLEHFLAVVEERTFTRAAERVCRTQPAVSQSIKKLEEEVGAPLFARDVHEVSLTEAGRVLADYARRMVHLRDEALRQVTELKSLKAGTLAIAAHESAAVYLLPAPLRAYLQKFPDIKVGIYRSRLNEIPRQVMDREVDVGFVKDEPAFHELQWVEVHADEMMCIAAPTHPLASRDEVRVRDLGAEQFVMHHLCSATADAILRLFEQHSTRCRIVAELWSFENIKSFVQEGVGLAIVVRREDESARALPSRRSSPAGASPASVSTGAPSSRPQASGESPVARAGCQKPLRREPARGPQHNVKPAASTHSQSESRAGHVAAKATSAVSQSGDHAAGLGGVGGAARVHGEERNTRGPSAPPSSRQSDSYKPMVKTGRAQRASEGVVGLSIVATKNATGGKGPCGGHVEGASTHQGMAGTSGPNYPHRQPPVDKVRQLQRRLWVAAKRSPERRFHALLDRICRRDVLWAAWRRVKANRGAAGVDRETLACVEQYGVERMLDELHAALRAGTYRPQPVLRRYIPKADGRQRPLGIPTVRDRVAQMATTMVLEPIFEADFRSSSYGFRPRRSATQALETLRVHGVRGGNHVLDADIRDYFGSIDHAKLLTLVGLRISDRRVLKLLRQWLAAGVMEDGQWRATVTGSPQGGVISPLLSNIYLHVLDRVWEDRCAHLGTLVRYADDFVVMCDTKAQVEEAHQRVSTVLTRLGLELHPEKTRQVDLSRGREGFDFLGCHLRKRLSGSIWERTRRRVYYLHRWPSQRAMRRVRTRVRDLTPRARCHDDLRTVIADVNRVLRGWGQYFRTGNAATKFIDVDTYVEERLRGLLLKRAGSRLAPGRAEAWRRPFFEALGLFRLRGTIQYPGVAHATT